MAWYGKDGKQYATFNDKMRADDAWDKQRAEQTRQNALLAEQNRLLREQTEKKEKLELEKQEHDKEMRLLSICDSIGISKKIYDDYIEYLVRNNQEEKLTNLDNEMSKIQKIEEAARKGDYALISIDTSGYDDCYDVVQTSDKLESFKKELKDEKERLSKTNNSEAQKKNYKIKVWISAILTLASIIIALNTKIEDVESIFYILTFVFFGYLSYVSVKLLNVSNIRIKELESCIEKEKNHLNNLKEFNIDKFNQKKKKVEKELETEKNLYHSSIKKKYEDFLEFRKKHYNKDLEKYLLDMDFPKVLEQFDISYTSVSSKTKTSDGSIEDYIDYFLSMK